MSQDSTAKTIGVSLAVTIVSSILVSLTVVTLRPQQEQNKILDKKKNVLVAAGVEFQKSEIEEKFKQFTPVVVDLTTGQETDAIATDAYDMKKIMKDPNNVIKLTKEQDIAGIREIPKYQLIYLIKDGDTLKSVILPIFGKGLWSTVYGFIALDSDMQTVTGLTFYSHGETPGLGGEIENPSWQAIWVGKKLYSESGEVAIEIIKGQVTESMTGKEHKVDGLSGATLTARGVSNFIRFWAGDVGYGKVLKGLGQSEESPEDQGGDQ